MGQNLTQNDWERLRAHLFAFAYRMLGDRAEAEDVVHDTLAKWLEHPKPEVENPEAYLTRTVANRCTDRFRTLQAQRAQEYIGPWLPEPIVSTEFEPHAQLPGDTLSLGIMYLLEKLKPNERAAFVLRESFGHPYASIAEALDTSEANARQLVSRAHKSLASSGVRIRADAEQHRQVVEAFLAAVESQQPEALLALLRQDAQLVSDGGGKVAAARNVLVGANTILKFLWGLYTKFGEGFTFRPAAINHIPSFLIVSAEGGTDTAFTFELDEQGLISSLLAVRNPDKLIKAQLSTHGPE